MAAPTRKTERLLRMSISVYGKGEDRAARHEWAINNHVAKAAFIHAKHGIQVYQHVHTPPQFQEIAQKMSDQRGRGWIIDDHDATVEFYFKSLADMGKVSADPEWQQLAAEEEPHVERTRQRVSLGWVERYVDDGNVINHENGRGTYPSYAELSDTSTVFGAQPPQKQ